MSVADLPCLNACLNATATVLIIAGLISVKAGKIKAHIGFMIAALVVSTAFFTSYLIYHANAGSKSFTGEGWVRPLYFFILLTHIPAAVVNLPMIIATVVPAIRRKIAFHKRIARWTYPLWLYVSVTGVLVYFFAHVWYP
ncbi:MAG: putative membrane protein [Verrucomicrobiales bacterium]|jgi:putative membrane protein